MCLSSSDLLNYYKLNFALKKYHGYSYDELDEMIPFEKEIYVSLLLESLEKERQQK